MRASHERAEHIAGAAWIRADFFAVEQDGAGRASRIIGIGHSID
jgi:hypothetical protein